MRELIRNSVIPLEQRRAPGGENARAPYSDYDLDGVARATRTLTAAAVLVPLVDHDDGLSVLLTQRTDHLHDHAGQISFPGGRLEAADAGPVAAALRETEEEVGLASSHIEVVGYLDDYETITGYLVTPVVGFVTPGYRLVLDSFEVAAAFEVPLGYILDPANHQTRNVVRHGVRRRYYVVEYRHRYIWGATAGMLMDLYRRILQTPT